MSDSATGVATGVFAPGHLGELTQVIPFEMVDAALDTTGATQRRLRRLPSRVVVYLLVAGALFAEQGWRQVWARLTANLATPVPRPAGSSLVQAMRRVGPAPLRELFTLLAGPGLTPARFAGRLVVAIDGTQIPIPDTPANRRVFPKPRGGPNGQAGYPMIRLVALVATGTRCLIEAVFGPDTIGELAYADRLAAALRPGMILLGDRNFAASGWFTQVAGAGADFLIRLKTGTTAAKLPVLARLPDHSWLSIAGGVKLRIVEAVLTVTTSVETHTVYYRLATTIIDPRQASPEQLLRLYHQRWEIETAYLELKSTMLTGRVLRGKYPYAIEQETWALLCAHQGLRTAISDAMLGVDTAPDRASFTIALNTARDQIIQAENVIAAQTVSLLGRIGAAVIDDLLPTRGLRTRPRVIKRALSKYHAKTLDTDRTTYPATLAVQILTPRPDG